ncbi:MAG TPA: hypothetical protein VKT81_25280 [Bryobacteraceae bacterium]|nr:hypothetical protein [Bryobacteraceae bacterium]
MKIFLSGILTLFLLGATSVSFASEKKSGNGKAHSKSTHKRKASTSHTRSSADKSHPPSDSN